MKRQEFFFKSRTPEACAHNSPVVVDIQDVTQISLGLVQPPSLTPRSCFYNLPVYGLDRYRMLLSTNRLVH